MDVKELNNNFFDFQLFQVPDVRENSVESEGSYALVVFVQSTEYDENGKTLVSKIIQSINIDVSAAMIIKVEPNETLQLSEIMETTQTKKAISFGIETGRLMLNTATSSPSLLKFENYSMILTESLSTLTNVQDHKKKLWNLLKFWKDQEE